MIDLQIIRLLFDFGLVVLIWIVQLVIYPGFSHYQRKDLLTWHREYSQRISYLVFPLMLGQISLAGFQLWQYLSWYTISSILIIGLLWFSTFWQFVPLHQQISNHPFDEQTLTQLVQKNWLRTFLWSLLFIISMLKIAG